MLNLNNILNCNKSWVLRKPRKIFTLLKRTSFFVYNRQRLSLRRPGDHHQLRPAVAEEGRAGREKAANHRLRRVPLSQEQQVTAMQGKKIVIALLYFLTLAMLGVRLLNDIQHRSDRPGFDPQ